MAVTNYVSELEARDFSKVEVPKDRRISVWWLSATFAGFTMNSSMFLVGGTLASGFELRTSLIIAFIGSLVLTIYAALLGHIAFRTGRSFAMLLAAPFGVQFRKLPATLFALLEMGWLGVVLGITALAVSKGVGGMEPMWIILFMVFFTSTGILGIRHMSIFSIVSVPLITLLVIVAAYYSFTGVSGAQNPFAWVPKTPLPWHVGLSIAVGGFILSCTTSPDFTRFAKSSRDAVIAAAVGFLLGDFVFLAGGAIAASAYGNWDMVQNLMVAGLALPAVILLLLNNWTTYDTGLYTASVEMSVITKYSRLFWGCVLTIIAALIALAGIYFMIIEWLTLLSIVIPPIGGIVLADYFVLGGQNRVVRSVNVAGVATWVISAAVALLLNQAGLLMGIGGTVIAFIVYVVISKATQPAPVVEPGVSTSS